MYLIYNRLHCSNKKRGPTSRPLRHEVASACGGWKGDLDVVLLIYSFALYFPLAFEWLIYLIQAR